MLHYGLMGSIYMQKVHKIEQPRSEFIKCGFENDMRTELTKQAYSLFKETD
ncbi:hypothetical protein KHA80_19580 [Anaerobacillus sp. HL2]|nr:hypothetical protein KHA80_19580 [Anaerobacillus sp. HL2]